MRNWFEPKPIQSPTAVRPLARYRYVRLRWRLLFAIVDGLGHCFFGMFRRRQPIDSPRSLLVVQLDHLGDAILSIGMLRGLREAYPAARIDVLASSSNAELFQSLPEVDRVFVSKITRFSGSRTLGWIRSTIAWGWRLRREAYDAAIDPRGDFPSAVILWLCGASLRLGWGSGGGGFLLTHEAPFIWGRHEVLSRQALLDQLGIAPPPGEAAWSTRLVPSRAARECIDERLDDSSHRFVLHIGAGTLAKRWPAENWQQLISRLIEEYAASIVLVGSAADGAQLPAMPRVRNLCGALSIDELAALIERADAFIGADSGPAHLAAAVGTPAVVLFSGTNRIEQWQPWGEQVQVVKHATACSPCHLSRCPLSDHPCMSRLRPADVLAAVKSSLERMCV